MRSTKRKEAHKLDLDDQQYDQPQYWGMAEEFKKMFPYSAVKDKRHKIEFPHANPSGDDEPEEVDITTSGQPRPGKGSGGSKRTREPTEDSESVFEGVPNSSWRAQRLSHGACSSRGSTAAIKNQSLGRSGERGDSEGVAKEVSVSDAMQGARGATGSFVGKVGGSRGTGWSGGRAPGPSSSHRRRSAETAVTDSDGWIKKDSRASEACQALPQAAFQPLQFAGRYNKERSSKQTSMREFARGKS
ncbi:unnamed protein product [Discosporangium mesarthrocarpum]